MADLIETFLEKKNRAPKKVKSPIGFSTLTTDAFAGIDIGAIPSGTMRVGEDGNISVFTDNRWQLLQHTNTEDLIDALGFAISHRLP